MTYLHAKLITSIIFLIPGIVALVAPKAAAQIALKFPRHKTAGRVLSAFGFIWAAAIIYFVPLDFLMKFQIPIVILLLVSIPLSWKWMPDLLAARALGGLWCLIPAPVLVASRFADGEGRLIIVSLMYLIAVAGMISTFSPYYLRDALAWVARPPVGRIRTVGIILTVFGILALAA